QNTTSPESGWYEFSTSNTLIIKPRDFSISIISDEYTSAPSREVQFKWSFDKVAGTVSNTGNTWFKLLIKPGCDSTEEEGDA
ncbi:hypothetical protein PXW85_26915, partial [Klebsiella pneumoniae]|nr:hypothetical protein [Klebsiella pneumoniae]